MENTHTRHTYKYSWEDDMVIRDCTKCPHREISLKSGGIKRGKLLFNGNRIDSSGVLHTTMD